MAFAGLQRALQQRRRTGQQSNVMACAGGAGAFPVCGVTLAFKVGGHGAGGVGLHGRQIDREDLDNRHGLRRRAVVVHLDKIANAHRHLRWLEALVGQPDHRCAFLRQ